MSANINDAKQLVRSWLLGDDGLADAVGGNVSSMHLSAADAATILAATPLLVLGMKGGIRSYPGSHQRFELEVYAYSKRSSDEAGTVYELACARLQGERMTIVGLALTGSARETARPIVYWNEDVSAWYALGKWSFYAI